MPEPLSPWNGPRISEEVDLAREMPMLRARLRERCKPARVRWKADRKRASPAKKSNPVVGFMLRHRTKRLHRLLRCATVQTVPAATITVRH